MKRIPIPPSVFHSMLIEHGPMTIDDFGISTRGHACVCIRKLREAKMAHIVGWVGATPGNYKMIVAAGDGADVPRPKIPIKELNRRYRERAKERKRKALSVGTLPEHTPVYGMWGI